MPTWPDWPRSPERNAVQGEGSPRRVVTATGVPLEQWRAPIAGLPLVPAQIAVPLEAGASVLVFAAHPDDETLGVGGLLAHLASRTVVVQVACLTDGAAAFVEVGYPAPELAAVRRAEFEGAMTQLGVKSLSTDVLPDGELAQRSEQLDLIVAQAIAATGADLVLCPWVQDPHPDHAALGRSVLRVSRRDGRPAPRMYPIWMTHGMQPDDDRVDLTRITALELPAKQLAAKHAAIAEYVSQVRPYAADLEPVLPGHVLERFTELPELLIDQPEIDEAPSTAAAAVDPAAYFDAKMAEGQDSWNDESSWYERRKRSVVLASLPQERYAVAWEPACGGGQLTAELATRCDRLYASDGSPVAVAAARKRCAGLVGVTVDRVILPSPAPRLAGPVDLTVLSEFLYYLHSSERSAVLREVLGGCAPTADVVVAHWRHRADDTHESGDSVVEEAENFFTANGFEVVATHDDQEFLVVVLHRD